VMSMPPPGVARRYAGGVGRGNKEKESEGELRVGRHSGAASIELPALPSLTKGRWPGTRCGDWSVCFYRRRTIGMTEV